MPTPKYPTVTVRLSNEDGNAISIITRVSRALRKAKVPDPDIAAFKNTAMAGDYDHLIQTVMKWVNVE